MSGLILAGEKNLECSDSIAAGRLLWSRRVDFNRRTPESVTNVRSEIKHAEALVRSYFGGEG
jgi:hypothetical protein